MSGSGGTSLRSRQADNVSPTPSDDSDSDISLGTHSPVPSSLSLQHSPGSTSGGGNDDRLMHDDLQRDREKDFRSFSLGGFSFDAHSPAMAGKLIVHFLFYSTFFFLLHFIRHSYYSGLHSISIFVRWMLAKILFRFTCSSAMFYCQATFFTFHSIWTEDFHNLKKNKFKCVTRINPISKNSHNISND